MKAVSTKLPLFFLFILYFLFFQSVQAMQVDPAVTLRPGDRILAQWSNGWWYPAKISSVNGNSYGIAFDDGDTSTVGIGQIGSLNWNVGSQVQCKYQGVKPYYDARIGVVSGNMIRVVYESGYQEDTYVGHCRSSQAGVLYSRPAGSGYAVPAPRAETYEERRTRELRESSRDVPSDPEEFLRTIERNRAASSSSPPAPAPAPSTTTKKEDRIDELVDELIDEIFE